MQVSFWVQGWYVHTLEAKRFYYFSLSQVARLPCNQHLSLQPRDLCKQTYGCTSESAAPTELTLRECSYLKKNMQPLLHFWLFYNTSFAFIAIYRQIIRPCVSYCKTTRNTLCILSRSCMDILHCLSSLLGSKLTCLAPHHIAQGLPQSSSRLLGD